MAECADVASKIGATLHFLWCRGGMGMLRLAIVALVLLSSLGCASVACGIIGGLGGEVPATCPSGHMDAVPQPQPPPQQVSSKVVKCPIDGQPMFFFSIQCGVTGCFTVYHHLGDSPHEVLVPREAS